MACKNINHKPESAENILRQIGFIGTPGQLEMFRMCHLMCNGFRRMKGEPERKIIFDERVMKSELTFPKVV